eukprot:TRINITY_DN8005_c0_g1_i1.p3 TRINITY_DN8005_c0_g1~~TRINITY_DN8005_c0_g1_i1.p3  ORF type:complete len:197 (+),score=63.69 TRINITY_DN8005_c0_g1_i1:1257-1847(+)
MEGDFSPLNPEVFEAHNRVEAAEAAAAEAAAAAAKAKDQAAMEAIGAAWVSKSKAATATTAARTTPALLAAFYAASMPSGNSSAAGSPLTLDDTSTAFASALGTTAAPRTAAGSTAAPCTTAAALAATFATVHPPDFADRDALPKTSIPVGTAVTIEALRDATAAVAAAEASRTGTPWSWSEASPIIGPTPRRGRV